MALELSPEERVLLCEISRVYSQSLSELRNLEGRFHVSTASRRFNEELRHGCGHFFSAFANSHTAEERRDLLLMTKSHFSNLLLDGYSHLLGEMLRFVFDTLVQYGLLGSLVGCREHYNKALDLLAEGRNVRSDNCDSALASFRKACDEVEQAKGMIETIKSLDEFNLEREEKFKQDVRIVLAQQTKKTTLHTWAAAVVGAVLGVAAGAIVTYCLAY